MGFRVIRGIGAVPVSPETSVLGRLARDADRTAATFGPGSDLPGFSESLPRSGGVMDTSGHCDIYYRFVLAIPSGSQDVTNEAMAVMHQSAGLSVNGGVLSVEGTEHDGKTVIKIAIEGGYSESEDAFLTAARRFVALGEKLRAKYEDQQ